MQSAANWITRAKWLLIFALLVWGAFYWTTGYADCRAEGHNNVACGVMALFAAYFNVAVQVLVAVISFLGWVLP